jgi:hypothetical protein
MDDDARIVRLSTALFAAPVLGVSGCAMALAFVTICPGQMCNASSLMFGVLAGAGFGFVAGVPAMFVLGLPIHAILAFGRHTSLLHYAIAGALPGVVSAIVLERFMPVSSTSPLLLLPALGAVAGVVSAALFWAIRRPDLDPNLATPSS